MKLIHSALILVFVLFFLFTAVAPPTSALSQTNTIMVTSAANDGPGSLRYALIAAQPGTLIKFDPEVFPLDDPQVIYLTEELPEIYQGSVIIDASDAGVILDGSLLDVTTSALFDNFEFKVNDRVIFLSTFDHDIEYWNKEDPEFWGTELAWNPAGMEENEGSLAVTIQPDGSGHLFFYEETPNLSWRDLYKPNSPVWTPVNPGDRVTFSYDYLGFDHAAFFNGLSLPDDEVRDIQSQGRWASDEWRHATLSTLIPSRTYFVYPTFHIENYNHGAAIQISSNSNEVSGLVIRNFYKGIVVYGNDNLIGSVAERIEGCSEGCNRIEAAVTGIEVHGSRNRIAANWIGLTADGAPGEVTLGLTFSGENRDVDNQMFGNWIISSVSAVTAYGQDNLAIAGNWLGPDLAHSDFHQAEAIRLNDNMTGTAIGPDNTIINASFPGIVAYADSLVGTEIFENEIVGVEDCGVLLGYAVGTHLHDNWIGLFKDGTALPNENGVCLDEAVDTTIGPGNHFSYNSIMAISVGDSPHTQITANYFYQNNVSAYNLWGRVGDEPQQPVITAVSTATLTVVGSTSPNATVEIYYNQKSEGGDYVLTCNANAHGKFYCTIPKDQFQTDINVTALARFEDGGTSEFSESFYVATPDYSSITGITGPLSISTDPQVIGMSIAIAGLLLFTFNGLAEISSRLIDNLSSKNGDDKGKKKGQISKWTILDTRGKRWTFILGWALILILIAFAQSMLESYPPFSKAQLELTLLLLAVSAVLSLVEVGSEWIARKRWKVACQFCSEINFRGLFFVIGSVALSRILGFSPGVIVGMAGVVFLVPDLTAPRKGPTSFWSLLAIFLVSMAAWGLSVLFMEVSPIMETLMLTLFFLGVQSVFFSLIPFGDSNGKDIFEWKKGVWGVFSLISLAVFVYMIFMPAFTDVDAMRQNDYLTIYIIGGVLALISGLLWAANKWCWFEKKEPVKADSERSEPSDPPASDQT